MILAPATMAREKEAKEAARKCLEEIQLDPDGYRVGHTKARGILNHPLSSLNKFITFHSSVVVRRDDFCDHVNYICRFIFVDM